MPDVLVPPLTGRDPAPLAFREAVAELLEEFVAEQRDLLAPLGPDLDALVEAAFTAVRGGKRLRAAFVHWGWRAAGGSASEPAAALRAGAAVELVHASALTHDDVMDASATRRGSPSAHRACAAGLEAAVPGTATGYGASAAILLGDLLLAWSDEMFASADLKAKRLRRGRAYFDMLRREVVAGQYLDVLAQTRRRSSAADAMRVLLYKSAKYTVERPLQIGAALAKADDRLLAALSSYGVPLGEAFQLRDDILGVFGESQVTGKPSGDDLREGKRTLLVARAFDRASPEQRAVLEDKFGRADLDDAGVLAIQRVLRDTGALAAVETVITELTSAALAALRHAPIEDDEARTALHTLATVVTERLA